MIRILPFFILLILSGCKSKQLIRVLTTGTVDGPETFYHELPFTERSGLMMVEVKISGQKHKVVFDTGTPNVITPALARKLGLIALLRDNVSDSQEQVQQLEFTAIPEMEIGGVFFRDFGAVIVDWSAVPQLECFEMDGLLGANLMRRACWQVDYDKQVIRMASDCDAFEYSSDTLEIPFHTSLQGSPYIDLQLANLQFTDVLVDLGSNSTLKIGTDVYRQLTASTDLPAPLVGVGYGSAGIYGQLRDTVRRTLLPSLQVGDHKIENYVVRVAGQHDEIVLGNLFFAPYRPVFDWQRQRIILTIPEQLPPSVYKSYGISIGFTEERARIDFVLNGSQAEDLGLFVGQEVVRLDDYQFQQEGMDAFCEMFLNRADLLNRPEITLEVVMEDGIQTITLPLTEYIR